ncbi:5-oxoprolinase subunit PxpB [Collimonas pratensis]|uniref:Allophanate hydrolase subunit 1 family protein n=1 Tax=Collimonas pratensis TaxID=279113 RepID=A0A127QBU7_9BURK|nr:5-oxoprolinase subunit PxpB [Collimonas pratensis]AMP07481.1 allophanate hydrolase subunit 1 family protein [Collimonas pratensis]
MTQPVIQALGENALILNTGASATLECQQRLWAIAAKAAHWPHVRDVVPGMNNLTILFDPLASDGLQLAEKLQVAWDSDSISQKTGRKVDIPVVYGGDSGPDLEEVARHTGLSPAEIVKRHTAAEYIVYFIGFQPGFPYLGGLDPKLATPRRSEPRLLVPAGSVGIGGSQTGIYPAASPGGWQLIGRSELQLFDPDASPPTLLQPGDRVRFVASEVIA